MPKHTITEYNPKLTLPIFTAVLISKETMEWQDIPQIIKAFDAKTLHKEEAEQTIHPNDDKYDADEELNVLVFMRTENVKEYINDNDAIIKKPPLVDEYTDLYTSE